jgi:hypothetical protein
MTGWSHAIKDSENAVMLQPTFPVSSFEFFVKRVPTPPTPTPRHAAAVLQMDPHGQSANRRST